MFDHRCQLVGEMVAVAGVAVLVEVESGVDSGGRVIFGAVPIEALELHSEDVGSMAD